VPGGFYDKKELKTKKVYFILKETRPEYKIQAGPLTFLFATLVSLQSPWSFYVSLSSPNNISAFNADIMAMGATRAAKSTMM
jgi:hypothetical protein